jgi:peptide-methionine (S)-S-oxide reductase
VRRFAEEAAKTIHTQVVPFVDFLPSQERYQNYYRNDPNRPFCRRYIDPKLDLIRREYAEHALPGG